MLLSNLSEISKLPERAIHCHEYFERYKLFHPNHHGFLINHSTTTAIQQIFDEEYRLRKTFRFTPA
jgi:hypothetical protein